MPIPRRIRVLLLVVGILALGAWLGARVHAAALAKISSDAITLDPWLHALEAASLGGASLLLEALLWGLALRKLAPLSWELLLLIEACTWTGAALLPLRAIARFVALEKGVELVALTVFYRREIAARVARLIPHVSALLLFFSAQLALNGTLSPLLAPDPIVALARHESKLLPLTSGLQREDYVAAKRLDLIGFDETYWGGVQETPTAYRSPLLRALAILLDAPAIDVAAFYRLLRALLLAWCVAGSFGFYLWLRYRGLSEMTALLGGLLFIFGNPFFAVLLGYYFPSFVGPYLCLPYALLAWDYGIDERSPAHSLLAGLCLALPFYLLANHPDAVSHALGVFLLYQLSRPKRVPLSYWPLPWVGFALGSAAALLPLAFALASGEARFFGHQELMHHTLSIARPLLAPLGRAILPWLAFLLLAPRDSRNRAAWVLLLVLIGIVFPGKSSPLVALWNAHSLPKVFLNFYRVEIYLPFALLCLALPGVEAWCRAEAPLRYRRWERAVSAAALPWGKAAALLPAIPKAGLLIAAIGWQAPSIGIRRLFVLLLTGALLAAGATHEWQSANSQANPWNCSTYVSLQSLTANYRAMGFRDEASLRLLRSRLESFERKSGGEPRFTETLARRGVSHASSLSLTQALDVATESAMLVDRFETRGARCLYSAVDEKSRHYYTPRVAYGDAAALEPLLDGGEHRILGATGTFAHLGVAEGFRLNNALMTSDARYMRGYPTLFALYLLPGQRFRQVGQFDSPSGWTPRIDALSSPLARKLYGLSGIDTYLVSPRDFASLVDKRGLEPLPFRGAPRLVPPFLVVRDHRAMPVASIASTVDFIPPEPELFRDLAPPFPDTATFNRYSAAVGLHLRRLYELPPGHVLIEKNSTKEISSAAPPSEITRERLVGGHLLFDTACHQKSCWLVVNEAALGGWKAYVDKKRAAIHRANFAFLGVELPSGQHRVWLEYETPGLALGVLLTMNYLFALITALIRREKLP